MHRKKERTSIEKKHKRLNWEDVFATNYAWEVLEEEGDVSVKSQEGILHLGHRRSPAGFRKGTEAQILLWWPYSFSPNSLGPLFPSSTPFACLPSSFLFSSFFFPNPFLLQREEERTFYLYTSLFILLSFSTNEMPMLVWRNHLSSFMFRLPPTWVLGKTSS